ncbi:MAG: hypothetical protein OSA41_05600 [Erythrobacter sp.]|jgi:hypothetical protein|nr:hypothetical protein [Verrucomicrobiales bacterium]MDE0901172.1 hypothetical protein [Erythrobacter sp.]|tara:strand:+ start:3634 stop:4182 length:549 start_codon:yes stop_codon:yes gene_type:complete
MKRGAIFVCAMLAACGDDRGTDPLADSRLEWRQLDDGSHYGHAGGPISDFEYGIRCWPNDQVGFRCAEAQTFRGAGLEMTTIGVGYHPKLPDLLLSVGSNDGYGCSYGIEYREEILRGGDALVSTAVTYGRPRWQRSYVERFMADNAVTGQQYFDCLAILQAINRGSMETLTTTEVTEEMLQ